MYYTELAKEVVKLIRGPKIAKEVSTETPYNIEWRLAYDGDVEFDGITYAGAVIANSRVSRKRIKLFTDGQDFDTCTIPTAVQLNKKWYLVVGLSECLMSKYSGKQFKLNMPKCILAIGQGCFSKTPLVGHVDCSNVYYIGPEAFELCRTITGISLPEPSKLNDYTIPNRLCFGTSIEELVIPDGYAIIGKYAFRGVRKLKKLVIPDTVTEIGDGAFYFCGGNCFFNNSNFEFSGIPANLVKLGESAFISTPIESVVLPKGVTVVPSYAFKGCRRLRNLVVEHDMKEIGSYAFSYCDIDDGTVLRGKIKCIHATAFENNMRLDSISIWSGTKIKFFRGSEKCAPFKRYQFKNGKETFLPPTRIDRV